MTKKERSEFDVLVIGGGPAGSACAIRLANAGARVALIDSSDFSRFRIGETIEPEAGTLLLQLGLDANNQSWSAPCSGVTAAWGTPNPMHRPSLLNPLGRGWRVERREFDRALFAQAQISGATTLTSCHVASAERKSDMWLFTLATQHGPISGRAAWMVAATGRSARTPLAPSRSRLWLDRLVGIALLERTKAQESTYSSTTALVEAAPCGWWYSAIIPHNGRLAVFFTDADLLAGKNNLGKFLRGQLSYCPLIGAECAYIHDWTVRRDWCGFDARSSIRRIVISNGWVALGDAAIALDPLCGRGITEALRSGTEVGEWLLRSSRVDQNGLPAWAERAATRFNDFIVQRRATYARETRWANSRFWQRRQSESAATVFQSKHD